MLVFVFVCGGAERLLLSERVVVCFYGGLVYCKATEVATCCAKAFFIFVCGCLFGGLFCLLFLLAKCGGGRVVSY